MGVGPRIGSASAIASTPLGHVIRQPANPDPSRYSIRQSETVGDWLIVEIKYLGVTNFEGNKILVFRPGVTMDDLLAQKLIDPHFSDSQKIIHPVARFEPTPEGRALARLMCWAWERERRAAE